MKPSEHCKRFGLTLARVAEISEQSEQTLINWSRNKPKLFAVVVAGCVAALDCDLGWGGKDE